MGFERRTRPSSGTCGQLGLEVSASSGRRSSPYRLSLPLCSPPDWVPGSASGRHRVGVTNHQIQRKVESSPRRCSVCRAPTDGGEVGAVSFCPRGVAEPGGGAVAKPGGLGTPSTRLRARPQFCLRSLGASGGVGLWGQGVIWPDKALLKPRQREIWHSHRHCVVAGPVFRTIFPKVHRQLDWGRLCDRPDR